MRLRFALRSGAWMATVWMACAGTTAPPASAPASAAAPSAAGTWVWQSRAMTPFGDLQMEAEQWRLNQRGDAVDGSYDRWVMTVSGDGRPYRCNAETTFLRKTTYTVRGHVRGDAIEMEETDFSVDGGPCEDGIRNLDAYQGWLAHDQMVLSWGTGQQVLVRQAPDGPSPAPGGPGQLAGTWTWEHRTVDPDGDRKVEQEEWVLAQEGDDVSGYYDSEVTFSSGDGHPFGCNQKLEYSNHARFTIAGVMQDGELRLKETAYTVRDDPCEHGKRRLASYRGRVSGDSLVLDWGSGRQTLKRRR